MDNNMPSRTGWVIIFTLLLWLVWEIYVLVTGKSTTISEEFWKVNDRTHVVNAIFFFIAGHLFWGRRY